MSKDKINQNRAQRILFNSGKREIAAHLRSVDYPEFGGNRRSARKAAKIVAEEAADPVDVRLAGARRIGRRAATAVAVVGVGVAGAVVANEAFDNSPSFQREKNNYEGAPAEGNDASQLHPDATKAEITVTPKPTQPE